MVDVVKVNKAVLLQAKRLVHVKEDPLREGLLIDLGQIADAAGASDDVVAAIFKAANGLDEDVRFLAIRVGV